MELENVELEVRSGTMFRSAKNRILADVSVSLAPGEFVGILGASGSGKSTLIRTMAGLTSPSAGRLVLDGATVPAHDLRRDRRIAYLPQDVVIHEQLTIRRALTYVCELKGVGRSRVSRNEIIEEVAGLANIRDRLDLPVRRLSGGQRKRAALAAELIGEPQLILLDEVTSGLDPATEDEMMRLFRSLADQGRTVVCITHFPNRLALCDRLIYLMRGEIVFVGPPQELQKFFGVESIEEVYFVEGSASAEEWKRRAGNATGTAKVAEPAGAPSPAPLAQPAHPRVPVAGPDADGARVSGANQLGTLVSRYFALLAADWTNLLLLVAQAPAVALMIGACYLSVRADFFELQAADTKEVIFLLVVAILWCSGMLAVREIVKEQSINRHEVRFGLRMAPYMFSKLVLLALISVGQAAMLLGIVRATTELTGDFGPQFLVLAATAIVGVAVGLFVSTVAGSSERAMTGTAGCPDHAGDFFRRNHPSRGCGPVAVAAHRPGLLGS